EVLGQLHRALDQKAEAADELRQTIAWADGAEAPGFGVRARVSLAAVLDDDDPELVSVLRRAHADGLRLGMAPLVAEAEQRLRSLGATAAADPALRGAEASSAIGLRPTVRTLGEFAVVPAGGDEPAHWSSKKARDALKILVCRRGRAIPREELIDLLWPEVELAVGRTRLSVVLSIVRGAFDPGRQRPADDVVRADRQSVALRLEHVDVDVERFLRLTEAGLGRLAAGNLESAHAVLTAAVDEAWRGPFLAEDRAEDWSVGMRATVESAYVSALRALGRLADESGDLAVAAERYAQLVDHDPYDEAAHRSLLAALDAAGRHGEARRQREVLAARLRELGLPEPH
ncbi:MAG: transcriptional activator domain protein, partial [Acidimicrobiales bacterium]|nr:transcriptional activator domain protein [Acidimicrobiales bacterium]